MEVYSPTLYDFRITFAELRLMPVHIHDLQLNGSREAVLTDKQLLYQTQPLNTDSSKIVFQVCGNSLWLTQGQLSQSFEAWSSWN